MHEWRRVALLVWLIPCAFFAFAFAAEAHAEEPSSASPSAAAPGPETPEVLEAREAFRLGSALAKEAAWIDALAAFRRSAELRPHPVTTYNIAYSERALGHFTQAYQGFARALEPVLPPLASASSGVAAAAGAPGSAVTLPPELAAQALTYLAETEQRVARVNVTLSDPAVSMWVDGRALEPLRGVGGRRVLVMAAGEVGAVSTTPATFELWVDPGTHGFVGVRPGRPDALENHSFVAGTTTALRFPEPRAVTPAPEPAPSAPDASPAANAPEKHEIWGVDIGVGFGGALRDDAYVKQLGEFGYTRDVPDLQVRWSLGVSRRVHGPVSILLRLRLLDAPDYSRSLITSDTKTFGWATYALGAGARGTFPLGGDVLAAYGQLELGPALGSTSYHDGNVTPAVNDSQTFFGFQLAGAAGFQAMPWQTGGLFLEVAYAYAPVVSNLLGDTHDSGGFTFLLGFHARTWGIR